MMSDGFAFVLEVMTDKALLFKILLESMIIIAITNSAIPSAEDYPGLLATDQSGTS